MSGTFTSQVKVGSAAGLHARPAAVVVKAAKESAVKVMISRPDEDPVPLSSILRLLGLGIEMGETVELSATGDGAEAAVSHLADLIGQELDPEGVG